MGKQLFQLGRVVATPAALSLLEGHNLTALHFVQKHVTGQFGDLCDEDKEANNEAIWNGERVLSSYKIGNEKLWVITEADRSSTCCLLSQEY